METENDRAIDYLEDLSEFIDHAVVGPKDNRIHEIRTTQFPFNTICHLERDYGDGLWRGCTGTLIAPRTILAAGHCIYSHRLRRVPTRIRVSPGRSDRDTRPYGSVTSTEYYVPSRYVNARTRSHRDRLNFDYGIIILPTPFQRISRFMEMSALSDQDFERLKHSGLITIAGYPADRPVGTLWRHTERLKTVSPGRLFYTVDTCPGHSGSPIWHRHGQRRHIIGVHTSGMIDEMGRAYGCSRGTIMAPPGAVNSGVRITPAILAQIREPARSITAGGRLLRFP